MSDGADIGHGMLFKRGDDGNPQVFATVPGLIEPALPTLSKEMKDSTDTESANRYREKISGLLNAEDLTLTLEYLPGNATQQLLYTDLHAKARRNYQLVGNDGASTTFNFVANVSQIAFATPLDDKKTIAVTLSISGKPTLT